MALGAYDRIVGLEPSELAVDSCITKAPCGGEKAGTNPVDRGKRGIKRSVLVDGKGIPLGSVSAPANRHDSPLLAPHPRRRSGARPGSQGRERPSRSWLRFRSYPPTTAGARARRRDLQEGKTSATEGYRQMNRRAYQRLAKCSQEVVGVVYRASGRSHRLLVSLLGGDNHREETHLRRMDLLPLGGATTPPTVAYWRRL
jgi:hypothetical protein